jgi:hypothetical protein
VAVVLYIEYHEASILLFFAELNCSEVIGLWDGDLGPVVCVELHIDQEDGSDF